MLDVLWQVYQILEKVLKITWLCTFPLTLYSLLRWMWPFIFTCLIMLVPSLRDKKIQGTLFKYVTLILMHFEILSLYCMIPVLIIGPQNSYMYIIPIVIYIFISIIYFTLFCTRIQILVYMKSSTWTYSFLIWSTL